MKSFTKQHRSSLHVFKEKTIIKYIDENNLSRALSILAKMQSTGRELYAVFYHNSASSFSDLRGPVISNVTRDLLTMTSRGNSKRTNRFLLRQFFNFFFSLAFGTSAFEQLPAKIQFSAPKLSFPKIVSTFL